MALVKRGEHWYGDDHVDLREEIARFANLNGYPAEHFADARCSCGGSTFRLAVDDNQGAAVRVCMGCADEHAMGDSAEYLDDAELETCSCVCESEALELSVGVSLYAGSADVRWLYLGCRCTDCGLVGVYADWKNEYTGYQQLLRQV